MFLAGTFFLRMLLRELRGVRSWREGVGLVGTVGAYQAHFQRLFVFSHLAVRPWGFLVRVYASLTMLSLSVHSCWVELCLAYVIVCEWWFGCLCWLAWCLCIELWTLLPPSVLLQERCSFWAQRSVSCVDYLWWNDSFSCPFPPLWLLWLQGGPRSSPWVPNVPLQFVGVVLVHECLLVLSDAESYESVGVYDLRTLKIFHENGWRWQMHQAPDR